ncbi:unnamed protein product, partial [Ranitomeya imitator]
VDTVSSRGRTRSTASSAGDDAPSPTDPSAESLLGLGSLRISSEGSDGESDPRKPNSATESEGSPELSSQAHLPPSRSSHAANLEILGKYHIRYILNVNAEPAQRLREERRLSSTSRSPSPTTGARNPVAMRLGPTSAGSWSIVSQVSAARSRSRVAYLNAEAQSLAERRLRFCEEEKIEHLPEL